MTGWQVRAGAGIPSFRGLRVWRHPRTAGQEALESCDTAHTMMIISSGDGVVDPTAAIC